MAEHWSPADRRRPGVNVREDSQRPQTTGLDQEEKWFRKPVPQGPPLAVDVIEAARQLSVSPSTVYALLRQGDLTSFYSRSSRRIPMRALEDYVARQLAAN